MFRSLHRSVKMPLLAASTLFFVATATQAQNPTQPDASAPLVPYTQSELSKQLDPQMAQVILLFNAIKGTPAVHLTPQDARQQLSAKDAAKILARVTRRAEAPRPVGKVQDGLTILGSDGNQIPIRIYTPQGSGPFPVILYFHGGGFVLATIDTYDESPRALCDDAESIVVSVEYRKAPEAPFPAARHDAISAYKWITNNIGSYNGIATKVAVAGESAGGNLAAEVALAARDESLQRPTHQLLIYPVTSANLDQPSDILYSNAVPLNTPLLTYFLKLYADPAEAFDPKAAPAQADVHNLAPATIIAAEIDPLQSDGKAYANKLALAGNAVQYRLYPGTTHEFFGMGAVVNKARDAEQYGAARIVASFK